MTVKHSIFGYLLGEGFRNVFHNKKSSGASLAIMCATMLIFGLFFMIIENLNHAVETLESQQGMQVFIEKDATDSQITQIGQQLKQLDGVNTVTFVSKEEALNSVKEKLKDLDTADQNVDAILQMQIPEPVKSKTKDLER